MKRLLLIGTLFAIGTLLIGAAFAGGNGQGSKNNAKGAGQGKNAGTCPYGYNQTNPNAGGWWTKVTAETPEEIAFLTAVTDLHKQIRQLNLDIAQMKLDNAAPEAIQAKLDEVEALRDQLHEMMFANQTLHQTLMLKNGMGGKKGTCTGIGSGWWTRVEPQTDEQKTLLTQVSDLHNKIRTARLALADLQANNGSPEEIQTLTDQLTQLRTELHDLMLANRDLVQTLRKSSGGNSACGIGKGGGKGNGGVCPYGNK